MIFTYDNIFNNKNIHIYPIEFTLEKSINLDKNITYMSIVDNYIYCRISNNVYESQHYQDLTSRINIINPLEVQFDNYFKINKDVASHNMYFFKDKENNIKSIGGQHLGINSLDYFKNNIIYYNYHNSNLFIDSKIYGILMSGCHKIYNPSIPCPYYANGLHLFEFNKVSNIDAIVHLAAQPSVQLSITNFSYSSSSNLLGAIKVIDYCRLNEFFIRPMA